MCSRAPHLTSTTSFLSPHQHASRDIALRQAIHNITHWFTVQIFYKIKNILPPAASSAAPLISLSNNIRRVTSVRWDGEMKLSRNYKNISARTSLHLSFSPLPFKIYLQEDVCFFFSLMKTINWHFLPAPRSTYLYFTWWQRFLFFINF